jgi:CDP-diacylglycerol--glycerol-3-phosphate 3-phosphatidyltransferase
LHGGIAPTRLVGGWLVAVYQLARPLRRVPPWLLTLAGVLLGWSAPLVAAWPVLAAGCVLAGALCDALDGAVAVLSERVSTFGAVLDAVADRLTEAAYGVALWRLGVPGPLCAAVVGVGWLHEYVRARAGVVGAITVAERPTRVLFAFFLLLSAGVAPRLVPPACAVWLAVALVGAGQLRVAVRRTLRPG